jgi:sRNA-binding carbon storage regulator CsrA
MGLELPIKIGETIKITHESEECFVSVIAADNGKYGKQLKLAISAPKSFGIGRKQPDGLFSSRKPKVETDLIIDMDGNK